MLKLNFRSLFLMLSVIILLIVSVSCTEANIPNSNGDFQNDDDSVKNGSELSANIMAENVEITSRCAEPYIQNPSLSWVYSLDIKVEDGKIYINDVLYEKSSSVPPAIIYNDGFLGHADNIDERNGNKEVANTLSKIKNCDFCYLLETKQDSKFGQKISVYEIDGAYYFIRFFENGEVMRIHRATI